MYRAAITASPVSHSESRSTFRTAGGNCPAARAGLGGETFADFLVPRAFSNGLVREHLTEARPRSIKNGLRHLGSGESCGRDVPDSNMVDLSNDASRELVKCIPTTIDDLGMELCDSASVTRALSLPESFFQSPVVPFVYDLFASGERGEVFQTEINADAGTEFPNLRLCDFDRDVEIPPATTITGEVRSVLDGTVWERPGMEHAECIAGEPEGASFALEVSALEWYPAERLPASPSQERSAVLVSGLGVLLADRIDGAGMQTEFLGRSLGEIVEIESARPALPPFDGVSGRISAKVPDEIHGSSLPVQQPRQAFHAIAIDEHHGCILLQERRFLLGMNAEVSAPNI